MKQEICFRLITLIHAIRMALPIAILLCAEASAVPMIPLGPVDVGGTTVDLKWVPAKPVKGITGMSGNAGVDRIIPAHFLAALRPYAGPDAQLARLLNHRVGAGDLNPADFDQAPAALVVWVLGVRPHQLKVGMRILLPSYTLFGDEGGIGVQHDLPVIGARPRHHRKQVR
jgi:hypothetical protein